MIRVSWIKMLFLCLSAIERICSMITYDLPLILIERRIGGFLIFRPKRSGPDFLWVLIRALCWVFLRGQNFEIPLFDFLCLGYPPGVKKQFLSFIFLSYIYFNRTHCADYEYHIFLKIWSSNKKIMKDFPYRILTRK